MILFYGFSFRLSNFSVWFFWGFIRNLSDLSLGYVMIWDPWIIPSSEFFLVIVFSNSGIGVYNVVVI